MCYITKPMAWLLCRPKQPVLQVSTTQYSSEKVEYQRYDTASQLLEQMHGLSEPEEGVREQWLSPTPTDFVDMITLFKQGCWQIMPNQIFKPSYIPDMHGLGMYYVTREFIEKNCQSHLLKHFSSMHIQFYCQAFAEFLEFEQ